MNLSEHAIRLRTREIATISGPGDFGLEVGRAVDSSRMFDADVSPYCFDFPNRTLFCVSTPDISGATFFYQAQRLQARSVIKIPFESLPEGPPSPALIFSIGRCGSTLLVRALEAAGLRAVSEPDFYHASRLLPAAGPFASERNRGRNQATAVYGHQVAFGMQQRAAAHRGRLPLATDHVHSPGPGRLGGVAKTPIEKHAGHKLGPCPIDQGLACSGRAKPRTMRCTSVTTRISGTLARFRLRMCSLGLAGQA